MAERKKLLLFMVADLLSDDDVMDWFLADPEDVMKDYELSQTQRSMLYSLNPQAMGSMVGAEVQASIEDSVISPQWPVPESRLRAVEPSQCAASLLQSFHLYGEGLMCGAQVVLRPTSQPGPDLEYVAEEASGTYQATKLTVRRMDLSTAPAGQYRVLVKNGPSAECVEGHVNLEINRREPLLLLWSNFWGSRVLRW